MHEYRDILMLLWDAHAVYFVFQMMRGYRGEPYRGEQMPGRVTAIKWLGVIQLIMGILLFIITIVLFSVDFEHNKGVVFFWHVLLAVIVTLLVRNAMREMVIFLYYMVQGLKFLLFPIF